MKCPAYICYEMVGDAIARWQESSGYNKYVTPKFVTVSPEFVDFHGPFLVPGYGKPMLNGSIIKVNKKLNGICCLVEKGPIVNWKG